MTRLLSLYASLARAFDRPSDWLLPTLARIVFAGVLLGYFWSSARTKFAGPFTPSTGAYVFDPTV